jgi:hypothetical protein
MTQGLKKFLWNKGKIRGPGFSVEELAQRRERPRAASTSFFTALNA